MVRKRGISSAYRELQQALVPTGRFISATRLERWAYWRRGGLIDRPQRHGKGRGTRSEFLDLERARDQAAAVADVLRPRMSLDTAALLLHSTGHKLLDRDVKDALLAKLRTAHTQFLRDARAEPTSDPEEWAFNAGWAAYRFFSRGERAQRRRNAKAALPDARAWTTAGRLLLGERPSSREIQLLIRELPISPALKDLARGTPDERLEALAERASFPKLIEAVAALPAGEVAQTLRTFAPLTKALARSPRLAGHDELSLGLGIVIGYLLGRSNDDNLTTTDLTDELRELRSTELVT